MTIRSSTAPARIAGFHGEKTMKKSTVGAVLALMLFVLGQGVAFAGNCTYDSDRASDGSRCGKRSSTSRDGGK
jgi:hypothetical protein